MHINGFTAVKMEKFKRKPNSQGDKSDTKRTRNVLTILQKVELLKKLDCGTSVSKLQTEYGVGKSTIYDVKAQKENILQFVSEADSLASMSKRKTLRGAKNSDHDKALYEWFRQRRSEGLPISGPMLMEKASQFHKELNIEESCEYSAGWLQKFRIRHGIRYLKVCGEKMSANVELAEEYVVKFSDLVKQHNLTPEQIYNMDETGLFWRCLPRSTLACSDEKSVSGGKDSKERLTVMLCSNAAGTHKCKMMVIGKSAKPRVFKGMKIFPVLYRSNKRAWVTQELFKDWFSNHFVSEARAHARNVGLPDNAKIVLLIDNCPAHPLAEHLVKDNVFVSYLPPNCTALIQPMDQGIIKNLKCHYRKKLLQKIVHCEDSFSHDSFKKSFTLKDAVWCLSRAWNDVTSEVLKNCWHNILVSTDFCDEAATESCNEFRGFDLATDEENTDYSEFISCVAVDIPDLRDEDIKKWISIDGDAPVTQSLTDAEIIDSVIGRQDAESDSEEDCAAEGEEASCLSMSEAISSCEQLIHFMEQKSFVNEQEVMQMYRLKDKFVREKEKHIRQVKLTDLFTPSASSSSR